MGTIAARHAREIVRNVEHVLAIELHCACEALGFRTDRPGKGTRKAVDKVRHSVDRLAGDRVLSGDIETIVQLIRSNAFAGVLED